MTSTKDTEDAGHEMLVISDGTENLYIVQRQTLEAGRVFDEIRERLEQLVAGSNPLEVVGSHGPYRVVRTIRYLAPDGEPEPTHR